jgi:hypothetical protein
MTLSKDALLGASDLVERDVNLPSIGGTVRVRSLPAAYSNQAQSEALEMVTIRGEQTARVNVAKLEALQVLHGLIDPKLDSIQEAQALAQKLGPSWRRIVTAIDEISGVDKEAIERTNALFQPGGQVEELRPATSNGTKAGDGGPDLPARVGAGTEDAGRRDV